MRIAILHQKYTPFGGGAAIINDLIRHYGSDPSNTITAVVRHWKGDRPASVQIRTIDPWYIGSTMRDWSFESRITPELLSEFDLVVSDQKIPGIDVYIAGGGVHREFVNSRLRRANPWQRLMIRLQPQSRFTMRAEQRVFASKRLRAVICVSQIVKADILANFDVPAERLHVVYNGIDLQRFDRGYTLAERERLRREHGLADRRVLLFVGGGMQNKGIETVLQAVARSLPDLTLLVVGKDKKTARFERLAQRLGIGARCRFVGPQADVRPWYAMADLFVLDSYFETFGLVALEAMAMGVPVLVSRRAGVSELIEDGRHGYRVEPGNVEDLAARIGQLSQRPEAMAEACVALAQRHSTAHMVAQMNAVFDAIGSRPANP